MNKKRLFICFLLAIFAFTLSLFSYQTTNAKKAKKCPYSKHLGKDKKKWYSPTEQCFHNYYHYLDTTYHVNEAFCVCKYCGKHTYVRFYSNRGGNAEKHSFYYTKKTKAEEIKKCELCNRKIIRKKIKKGKWSNWKLKLGK